MSECPDSLNAKLLAKREEAEKAIYKEHAEVKKKLKAKMEVIKQGHIKLELMQEESSSLTNKSAILTSEISQFKVTLSNLEAAVKDTMIKIDEISPKLRMANLVLEKEELQLKPHHENMKNREKILAEHWNTLGSESDLNVLKKRELELQQKRDELKCRIKEMKEKLVFADLHKLNDECMILKKRNAAILRRKTRILEQLKKQVNEKKEELQKVRRSSLFVPY